MKSAAKGSSRSAWLAHPVLSLMLAASWLLLQESVAVPQLLAAAVLGVVVPRMVHGFIGDGARPRSAKVALRFFFIVLWDILLSNLTVARLVLSPGARPQPAWVRVPLDVQHPNAIVLLATIITTTPGTVSCIVDEERREILVHALDCSDPEEMAMQIKQRYEAPLKEILG
ncbi:Na+/H+ antiporter subunit E [Panacagrimonas sp.]|uniref:Na+/H+ antiporter subunit E n=1 Tax=Panacagrimonas sp. TaxID=2480088 RepID=UPI003B5239C5